MTDSRSVSEPADVNAFLSELRARRERLLTLARAVDGPAADDLTKAIDEIGEHLLVVDEELRAQSEHIDQSGRRLDRLVAAYEQLFADAPVAYVQTDVDGLIVRMNRAAGRLIGSTGRGTRSRTLAGALRTADRASLRDALSRLRAGPIPVGPDPLPTIEPLEAAVVRPDGTEVPVVLTARRSRDAVTARATFHWELRERVPVDEHPPAGPESVVRVMAEVAADLARQPTPADTLHHLVDQARRAVAECDEVGVTLVRARGRLETPAATGELAAACDRLQYELGEGPCLGAVGDSAPMRLLDVAHDRRWPRFAPRAALLGVRSMLAVPLVAPRGTVGALNLYSRSVDAFDDDDVLIAQAYATHAGIALAHAELEANLRNGLQTREEIGRAVGILMERHKISAAAAFDMLVAASQQSHRKLRDIATWIAESGEDPSAVVAPNGQRG